MTEFIIIIYSTDEVRVHPKERLGNTVNTVYLIMGCVECPFWPVNQLNKVEFKHIHPRSCDVYNLGRERRLVINTLNYKLQ